MYHCSISKDSWKSQVHCSDSCYTYNATHIILPEYQNIGFINLSIKIREKNFTTEHPDSHFLGKSFAYSY